MTDAEVERKSVGNIPERSGKLRGPRYGAASRIWEACIFSKTLTPEGHDEKSGSRDSNEEGGENKLTFLQGGGYFLPLHVQLDYEMVSFS